MKALLKMPGHKTTQVRIPNDLHLLQELVGGYIEALTVETERGVIAILCNEDGKILGLEPNFQLYDDTVVGTVVVVGIDGDDFTDCPLTPEEFGRFIVEANA